MTRLRIGVIALCLMAAGGCTRVVETAPLHETAYGYGPTCHSALGAYYLPRAVLNLTVQVEAESVPRRTWMSEITPTPSADRAQTFCLDYLAAATSEDIVTVERSPQGLLLGVSSQVTDKTPEIAQKIIEIGENLAIAGARQGVLEAQPGDKLTLQFDPFNWHELMAAKTALRRFGFCIYVEGHSFPVDGLDAAGLRIAGERWCAAQHPPLYEHPATAFAALPVHPELMRTGILYRPNVGHKIVVLRKADPGGRGPWQLFQSKRVEMPNVSPVLSIGVERALFTHRKTYISFNHGVIADVTIDKGSELEGFVKIPLTLAKAIVDVPAQIIQIRIRDTQNQAALLRAQGDLINATVAYRMLVEGRSGTIGRSGSPEARSGQFVGACVDGGGPPDVCNDLARNPR
jgi:hypothetical protein